jgi:hypothetical protein
MLLLLEVKYETGAPVLYSSVASSAIGWQVNHIVVRVFHFFFFLSAWTRKEFLDEGSGLQQTLNVPCRFTSAVAC